MADGWHWPRPQRIVGEIIGDLVPVSGRRSLDAEYPLAVLRKSGYHRDNINEISLVSVSLFSDDLDEAEALSDQIFSMLIDGRSVSTSEGIMDRARCEVSPEEIPVEGQEVYCVEGTYRIVTRRED